MYLSLQAVIFASSLTSSNICIHSQKQYNLLLFLQAVILASILTSSNISVCSCKQLYMLLFQGKLVPKLTLGPFLTLNVINGHKLKDWVLGSRPISFRIPSSRFIIPLSWFLILPSCFQHLSLFGIFWPFFYSMVWIQMSGEGKLKEQTKINQHRSYT